MFDFKVQVIEVICDSVKFLESKGQNDERGFEPVVEENVEDIYHKIKAINGQQVCQIDNISTLIDVCHDAYAMGRILHSDLTTEKCFIVKQNGMFAHGKTLREARDALLEKLFDDMPVAERIEKFMESHDLHKRYPNRDFFSWHHRLTGSCLQGRTAFAQDHGIVLDGSMTTKEFLEMTKDSYGGDITRRTIKAYEA